MELHEIGRLAVNERMAQAAFKKACDEFDAALQSGRSEFPTYEPERLALQFASTSLRKACDDFIQTCVCYKNVGDNQVCPVHGGEQC